MGARLDARFAWTKNAFAEVRTAARMLGLLNGSFHGWNVSNYTVPMWRGKASISYAGYTASPAVSDENETRKNRAMSVTRTAVP